MTQEEIIHRLEMLLEIESLVMDSYSSKNNNKLYDVIFFILEIRELLLDKFQ